VGRVVHEHSLGEVAAEDVEVLEKVAVHVEARIAVEALVDVAARRVEEVEEPLRVHLLAGGEDRHLKLARNERKEAVQVRPLAHGHLWWEGGANERQGRGLYSGA